MVEPVSVTTVCVGEPTSVRSTWLVSPGLALNCKVPPGSTARVDADADPATANVPATARAESAAVRRMERPPGRPDVLRTSTVGRVGMPRPIHSDWIAARSDGAAGRTPDLIASSPTWRTTIGCPTRRGSCSSGASSGWTRTPPGSTTGPPPSASPRRPRPRCTPLWASPTSPSAPRRASRCRRASRTRCASTTSSTSGSRSRRSAAPRSQYRLNITADAGPAVDGQLKACLIDRSTGRAIPWPADVRERLAAGGLQDAGR